MVAVFRARADQDAGGVVLASGVECGLDQFVAGGLQGMGVGENFVDLVVLDVAQNAVCGQQQDVAILGGKLGEIGGGGVLGAEGAGGDVLGGRLLGLFHGEHAAPHLLHHQGVVFG